jgi:hypothetical protein
MAERARGLLEAAKEVFDNAADTPSSDVEEAEGWLIELLALGNSEGAALFGELEMVRLLFISCCCFFVSLLVSSSSAMAGEPPTSPKLSASFKELLEKATLVLSTTLLSFTRPA